MSKTDTNSGQIVEAPSLAASYARKSDDDPAGIDAQHLGNSQKALSEGYMIPESPAFRFEDDDTTGVTKSRSGMDRLLQVVFSGQAPFKRVYIKDVTRHGRWDARYGIWAEVECERHGVELRFCEEEEHPDFSQTDSSQSLGSSLKRFIDRHVATQERTRLIKRVTGGMRYFVLRGFFPGARAPYAAERWVADKQTGMLIERVPVGKTIRMDGCAYKLRWVEGEPFEVVQAIYRWVEEGVSLAAIAERLTARGTPSPSGSPKWSKEVVRKIARNPIYKGDLIWGRTTRSEQPVESSASEIHGAAPILYQDFMPSAPVSRERWTAVNKILDGNRARWDRRKATKPPYLLSGLVVCEGCGAGWHGHTAVRRGRNARRYYRHGPSAQGRAPCAAENRYLRTTVVEDRAIALVTGVLQDDRLEKLVAEEIDARLRNAQNKDHAREISRIEKQKAHKRAALDRAIYDRAMAETAAERDGCQTVIKALGQEIDSLTTRLVDVSEERDRLRHLAGRLASITDRTQNLRERLDRSPPEERKEVVAAIIEEIAVSPDLMSASLSIRAL